MKKKLAVLSTTIMLGLGNMIAIPAVKAESNIQQQISEANSNITKAQDGIDAATAQINRINLAINENSKKIADTQNQIAATNTQIGELQGQIAFLNDQIQKRNEVLKKRALTYQETGGNVSYLDVLLGASSFKDLVDRASAVAQLVQSDADLLNQQQADKNAVEAKQAEVQKKLEQLTAMKTELDGMQGELNGQKAQSQAMQAQLQQTAQAGANQLAALRAQEQQTAAAAIGAATGGTQTNQPSSSPSSAGVSAIASAPAAPPSGGNINTVIRAGYKYIGNSVYVFGGGRTASDIANGYFDCSGFVSWAFSQAGISVPASTDGLVGAGVRVPVSQIQPGDLVFFNTYKTNGHVGIYLGGGSFIGSQSSTGVAIANMSGGYWAQHFAGVVVRVR